MQKNAPCLAVYQKCSTQCKIEGGPTEQWQQCDKLVKSETSGTAASVHTSLFICFPHCF